MTYTFRFQNQTHKISLEEGKSIEVEIAGKKIPVEFERIDDRFYSIIVDGSSIGAAIIKKGKRVEVFLDGELYEFESVSDREKHVGGSVISGVQEIKSPMPSRVVKILKNADEEVKEGEGVIVIEAMKMESELKSPIGGTVKTVSVKEGSAVESGTVLIVISSEPKELDI